MQKQLSSSAALIKQAAAAIRAAEGLLITAGAGMGVDSGLPDFRGPGGFWRAYPALAKQGIQFEMMANPAWFDRDPHLAWAFYGHRLNLYRQTEPHEGFRLLLEAGKTKPRGCFVFTSNVDGQFQKAGFDPERVAECHGSIHHLQCLPNCANEVWPAEGVEITIDEARFRAAEPLPRCPRCNGLARPNILMFGDGRWIEDRSAAQEERLEAWLEGFRTGEARLVVIELGAGSFIPTVRFTSERIARQTGAKLIRINPREPETPPGHISIPLGACAAVRQICRHDQPQ